MCPDHVPWSIRVKRSWETLSNASAIAEQVVTLLKYSNAMRYIHSGSGIESYLPKEILCLFLCGLPPLRISCCKTGSDSQQMKHHLFELETLSALAGGLFNSPILVASSPKAVPPSLQRRMETLGIAYVGPVDLPHLAVRLKELIR